MFNITNIFSRKSNTNTESSTDSKASSTLKTMRSQKTGELISDYEWIQEFSAIQQEKQDKRMLSEKEEALKRNTALIKFLQEKNMKAIEKSFNVDTEDKYVRYTGRAKVEDEGAECPKYIDVVIIIESNGEVHFEY